MLRAKTSLQLPNTSQRAKKFAQYLFPTLSSPHTGTGGLKSISSSTGSSLIVCCLQLSSLKIPTFKIAARAFACRDVYQAEVAVDFDPKFHTARLSTFAEHGIAPCAPSSSQQKFRFDQSTCGSQYPGSCALELLPN